MEEPRSQKLEAVAAVLRVAIAVAVTVVVAGRPKGGEGHAGDRDEDLPTLTLVRTSSSDALLPPTLLLTLMRLLLRGAGRTMALCGRWGRFPGDAGGELAMTGKGGRGRRSP